MTEVTPNTLHATGRHPDTVVHGQLQNSITPDCRAAHVYCALLEGIASAFPFPEGLACGSASREQVTRCSSPQSTCEHLPLKYFCPEERDPLETESVGLP